MPTRDSDSSSLKTRLKCKARQSGYGSHEIRMVNFVIFVVNGVSILKSMYADDEAEKQYSEMVATTFSCPFLSFKGTKGFVYLLLEISRPELFKYLLTSLLDNHIMFQWNIAQVVNSKILRDFTIFQVLTMTILLNFNYIGY